MKRLVFELPYQGYWRLFFGRNAEKVRVLEGLKCFKCDNEGFAIICKIRLLDKKMSLDDITEKSGSIKKIEALYKEKDGSFVIFMSGDYSKVSGAPRESLLTNVFLGERPEFTDVNTMKISLVGEDRDLQRLTQQVGELAEGAKILSLTRLKPRAESPVSILTAKQRRALLTAYGLGYYDVPRKVPSEDIARLLKIDKSTLAEHLRKAERRIVKSVLVA